MNTKEGIEMIKTTLKIDGMMCGMCEAHMIRKNFKVKKVTSSAKSGETVIISEDNIDTEAAKKAIKDIGYEMLSATSEPYEKKGLFHFGK
jgi:copper chaperone